MNTAQLDLGDRPARPWLSAAIAFVLLYCPLLALAFATISFSEEDSARRYIAHVAGRPPAPLPPLPVLYAVAWPDIALRRDPFEPLTTTTAAPAPRTAHH